MVVVLPVYWSVGQLGTWWHPPIDALVFAVMLAIAVPRALATTEPSQRWRSLIAILAGAAAATGCGMLLAGHSWDRAAGAAVFTAAVAATVWMRRFGATWRSVGTAAGLPFMAILVHPLPVERSWSFLGWMVVAALIAAGWAIAIPWSTMTATPPRPDEARSRGRTADMPAARTMSSSTRQAIQLALSLAAAFVAGQAIDPDHLVWPVLTAFLVTSGNRGRGDVLWKGAQRAIGALIGTTAATLLVGSLAPGDDTAIVAIFVILAIAGALRPFGYAFWAAGITAALAFLYGYFGQGGSEMLDRRLLGILIGSLLAVVIASFVVPIRTTDVFRQRLAALLGSASAAITTFTALTALQRGSDVDSTDRPSSGLRAAERDLRQIVPTLRAARRFGLGGSRHLADASDRALAVASTLTALLERPPSALTAEDERALAVAASWLGITRRRLARRQPTVAPDHAPTPHGAAPELLGLLDDLAGLDAMLAPTRDPTLP